MKPRTTIARLSFLALAFLDIRWLQASMHYWERYHAYADIGYYLSNWDVYKTTETWFLLCFAMFTVTTICLLWAAWWLLGDN